MADNGKRIRAARQSVERNKSYPLDEALKLVKEKASVKFDETVDIAMNLGVDPKHADQMVRGVCNLPKGSGRTVRVGVFARGPKADEAKANESASKSTSSGKASRKTKARKTSRKKSS